eukprot:10963335-Alexandrium_andersonii.AAC.1
MSASLVGSEMCIRDSTPHQPQRSVQHAAPSPPSHGGGGGGRGTLDPCVPVSYTHLTLPTICSV